MTFCNYPIPRPGRGSTLAFSLITAFSHQISIVCEESSYTRMLYFTQF